jgi:hypothetical protein
MRSEGWIGDALVFILVPLILVLVRLEFFIAGILDAALNLLF